MGSWYYQRIKDSRNKSENQTNEKRPNIINRTNRREYEGIYKYYRRIV